MIHAKYDFIGQKIWSFTLRNLELSMDSWVPIRRLWFLPKSLKVTSLKGKHVCLLVSVYRHRILWLSRQTVLAKKFIQQPKWFRLPNKNTHVLKKETICGISSSQSSVLSWNIQFIRAQNGKFKWCMMWPWMLHNNGRSRNENCKEKFGVTEIDCSHKRLQQLMIVYLA